MIGTALHFFEANPHPISVVLPPLTLILSSILVIYLAKHPHRLNQVMQVSLA
jgi:hypothetical protein